MPIYVIALEATREDNSGRDYTETLIDPDYGYFTDRAAAEAYVERLDAKSKARYEKETEEYRAKYEAHQKKEAEARALGFTAGQFWASRPYKSDYHTVVEIEEA